MAKVKSKKSPQGHGKKQRPLLRTPTLSNIPDAMLRVDKAGALVECKISKKSPMTAAVGRFVGKPLGELLPAGFAREILRHCNLAIQTHDIEVFEYHVSKTPFQGDYEVQIAATRTSEAIVILRNVTARKQREEDTRYRLNVLRKAVGGIIDAIALTVETRDPYTAGHQRRVANLARAIATEMRLSRDKIEGIRVAGVIHDLGKISVPAEILSKPGRIRPIEFDLIKIHPQVGYDILRTIDFPWPVAEIVHQHHEKMDGTGYPRGLKAKEILLEARILAVADVVEAMASHRPYRPALGIDVALAEITKNKNKFYDSRAVDACVNLFTKRGFSL